MTVMTKTMTRTNDAAAEKLHAVREWLIDHVPTAVIVAAIALYYVQLSNMG